ncbi:MAG TPA: flavin reductase family protein, partial [Micromonosporaceae bacterium]
APGGRRTSTGAEPHALSRRRDKKEAGAVTWGRTEVPTAVAGGPDGDEFRRFMSHWPTGVTVVTSLDQQTPVGCTANAVMSASLTPPLLVVALAQESTTLRAIRDTGAFGVNVLGAHQRQLCHRFAHGGQDERFRDLPYRIHQRLPLLYGVLAATGCAVRDTARCGDHVLVVGAPQWLTVEADAPPLVFHRHGYHALIDVTGEAPC